MSTTDAREPSPTAASHKAVDTRNKWAFAVGTLGRDMVYTMTSMFLIYFLTDILRLSNSDLAWASALLLAARLFDAVMDIVMGSVVDNTRTRWGQYKPWIAVGAMTSTVFTIMLFTDFGLRGPGFVALFAVVYLLWGLSWTTNDIPYWSMLPALTLDQKQRESIGALAKVFSTLGLFSVVMAIIPVTTALGGDGRAWTLFAVGACLLMLLGQSVTLFGVREPKLVVTQDRTTLGEIASVVFKNDQLLWLAVSMILFMTGYVTTTTFGIYFFKYAYRDEAMYTPFAGILGVGQLLGFLVFPFFAARFKRRALYTGATLVIVLGYLTFFFSPMNLIPIGISGLMLFMGQSFVVILMLVFITDTIEYGQWKLGRRNGAVTFALQPFINKVGAALSTAVVAATLILTGINGAATPDDVTPAGLLGMKMMMLVFPLVLIVAGYLIYLWRYRIDETFYAQLVADLRERGQLT
ncbi:MAG: glycoside-pentoside-hexuronide (GPH):cation symporter [Propionibacteriaceae bacterium]